MRSSRLLVAAFAAALAACGTKEGSSPPGAGSSAAGGTLVVASAGDASAIFPPFVSEIVGRMIQDQVFDRLAEIGPDLVTIGDKSFAPRLAEKWTWAADSLSIAFSIDPRARWHDGKPVTAADVRYSFKVFTDPKVGSPVAPTIENLDSVSVRDSLTAVVWFKKHTPEQFYDAAYQLVIFPEHVYGSIPNEQLHTSEGTRNIVGSGRFRVAKWEAGARIELVADTSNFRGRAKLDRVIMLPAAADPATAATQVLTGQADFMEAFPIDQVAKLDSSTVARPLVYPQMSYTYLGMNVYAPKSKTDPHPIFADIRVRRALSMAADRGAMLRNVFGDKGRIAHGPFPSNVGFADTTLHLPHFDTTAAKAMLDSSGWRTGADGMRAKNGRPLRFSIISPSSSLFRRRYGVLLQEAFHKVGAQVDIEQMDSKVFQGRMLSGDFDAILGSYGTDPSPSGTKQNWSTAGIGANGQNNLRYSNHKVDALLDSSTASFDPAKMNAYASRAFQTIIDDVPAIWLYDVVVVDAVNRRVTTAPLRADEWWANLADWTIPADKRIDRDRIGLTPAKP